LTAIVAAETSGVAVLVNAGGKREGSAAGHCAADGWYLAVMGDIREGRCPSCGHDEVIEAPLRQLVHYKSRDTLAPIGVVWHEDRGFFADSATPLNAIHVYVCRSCGFTQMYTESPGTIPIGEGHGTRVIKSGGGSG
jgi:predicted RNA-binding Zn-ribbon protein involved in translation (DUF1610 family)